MIQNILKDKIVSMILFSFILVALVASDFIVLDEEALVAACFVLFVLFAYKNAGDVIANELGDRSSKIQKELQKSFDQQRELLVIKIENQKKQLSLLEEVKSLHVFSVAQMNSIAEKRKKYILNKVNFQVNQQLRYASMKEKEIVESFCKDSINYFAQSVLNEFKSNNSESIESRTRLLQEGIDLLKNSAQ